MKFRLRHLDYILIVLPIVVFGLLSVLYRSLQWGLVIGALAAVVVLIGRWRRTRKPDYKERRDFYRQIERWLDSRKCGEPHEVDGFFVCPCKAFAGPSLRVWKQQPPGTTTSVDEYTLEPAFPVIRRDTRLGSIDGNGELDIHRPRTLKAIRARNRLLRKSQHAVPPVEDLRLLVSRLLRATPVSTS